MKAYWFFLALAVGLVAAVIFPEWSVAQAPAPTAEAWNAPAPQPTPTPTLAVQPMKFREAGLSLRQRRDMGLTFGNIRRVIAQGQQSGDIVDGMASAEVTAYVASKLLDENPQAFQDPGVDWDAVLAFIEKLIEIIMRLISLFSQVLPPDASGLAAVPFPLILAA